MFGRDFLLGGVLGGVLFVAVIASIVGEKLSTYMDSLRIRQPSVPCSAEREGNAKNGCLDARCPFVFVSIKNLSHESCRHTETLLTSTPSKSKLVIQ